MKIRPNRKKNTIIFFTLIIVVSALYWFSFVGWKLKTELFHYIFMAVWLIPSITLYLMSYYRSYYVLNDHELVQHQLIKAIRIPYDNIAYIDIKASSKGRNLYLILHDKLPLVLTQDKKQILLDELVKRCHKTLTVQELKEKGYLEWQNEIANDKRYRRR